MRTLSIGAFSRTHAASLRMLRFVAGGPRFLPHACLWDDPSDNRHRSLHVRGEAGLVRLRGSGICIRDTAHGDRARNAFDTRAVSHGDIRRLPERIRKFR